MYDGHGGAFVSRYLKANLYSQVCASLEAQEAAGDDDAAGVALGLADGSGADGAMPTVSTARLKRALTEASLEAHKLLMEVNPDNVPKFKDVAQFLAEDLERQS